MTRDTRVGTLTGLLALLVVLPLAACGGGGGTAVSGQQPPAPAPAHGSMAVKGSYQEADLRHFLSRTHWGVTDDKWERLNQIGLSSFIDEMLEFPPIGSTAYEQAAREILLDEEDPAGQEGLFPSRQDIIQWALYLMVHNPNTFQEVLTYFWHDHFATSSEVLGGGNTYWMKEHYELLREHGTGNIKDLVLRLSRDAAMLRWLDGVSSTKKAPNENYAREFLELFCLGVDNGYTQEDIVEASRAFTGYRQVTLDEESGLRGVEFVPDRHDPDEKVLFGITIPAQNDTDDYEAVVDITFEHKNAAEWFAKAMLSYFCYENPPQDVIDELAEILRNSSYDVKSALKRIFLSQAFYSAKAQEGFVKAPIEFTIGFMKSTGLTLVEGDSGSLHTRQLRYELESMGNVPSMPPTVNGWPSGELWLSAQGMVNRANFTREVIYDRNDQASAGYDVKALLPESEEPPTAEEALDAIAWKLRVTLDEMERTDLIHYLNTHREGDGSDTDDPFDQATPERVDMRVRGLLYILAQHPSYSIR